jgi:hypothetical protein
MNAKVIKDKRTEERISVVSPIILDDVHGVTRDVSVSGVNFEVNASYETGAEISFVIVMGVENKRMLLKCKGNVVRTNTVDKKTTVAAHITESVMEVLN